MSGKIKFTKHHVIVWVCVSEKLCLIIEYYYNVEALKWFLCGGYFYSYWLPVDMQGNKRSIKRSTFEIYQHNWWKCNATSIVAWDGNYDKDDRERERKKCAIRNWIDVHLIVKRMNARTRWLLAISENIPSTTLQNIYCEWEREKKI